MAGTLQAANAPRTLRGKTFLITGGDSGLGFEAASALCSRQAKVLIAGKTPEHGRQAVQHIKQEMPDASIESYQVDLASFASIKQFASQVQAHPLHCLVNNAAVFLPPDADSPEGFEITLAVNHFGPFYLTHLLLDSLKANRPSRIVNMGSIAESFARPDWKKLLRGERANRSGASIYGTTKAMNIMLAKEYSRRLRGQGVDCLACHPGVSDTPLYSKTDKKKPESWLFNLFDKVWGQSAEDGSISMVRAAADPSLEGHGFAYFGPPYKGPAILHVNNAGERDTSNPVTGDAEAAKEVYDETLAVLAEKVPDIMKYALPE